MDSMMGAMMPMPMAPTGMVPGAIADAGMTMAGTLGYGCGSPMSYEVSSAVPPAMMPSQPHMIERYGEPYGGVVEYLNRWAGR